MKVVTEQQARAIVLTAIPAIKDAMTAMNISPDDVKLTFAWRNELGDWDETVIGGPAAVDRSAQPVADADDVLLPGDGNVGDVPLQEGVDFFFGKPDDDAEPGLRVADPSTVPGESPIYDL